MTSTIKGLYHSRDLLIAWTGRAIRGRYQQSVLGWLWAVIQPAASVALFSIIFTQIVPIDTGEIPYPVFSYVAVVPWAFLSSSLIDMSNSLVQNMNLVTKIYFPREVLPWAAMLARLLDFGIAAGLLIILMFLYKVPVFPIGWLILPLILVIQISLILGLGLLLASLNIFYRDIQSLLTLGLQLWFYAFPIIYPVTLVPENLLPYYFLNPMAGILEAYRAVLIYERLPNPTLVVSGIISFIILILGYWFFKRVEHLFADIV